MSLNASLCKKERQK
jgi:hypothetical protein